MTKGRPKGALNDKEEIVEEQEETAPALLSAWHLLFGATTRLHFFKLFLNWKKEAEEATALPVEGLRIANMPNGQILYYYDFSNCHQYSQVTLTKFLNIPIEKLEKDYQRYILSLANDTRVVGKLLQKSVSRKVVWHRKRPNINRS